MMINHGVRLAYGCCIVLFLLAGVTNSGVNAQLADHWSAGSCVRCETIYDLDWSPDGKVLAVAASDGLVLYDSSSGFAPWATEQAIDLKSRVPFVRLTDQEATFRVAWNYNGTLLAAFQGSRRTPAEAHLRIWNTKERRVETELPTSTTYFDFDWSPIENKLAYSMDSHVRIWDEGTRTFAELPEWTAKSSSDQKATIAEDASVIWRIAWSPDDSYIAASGRGDKVILYSVHQPTELKSLDASAKPGELMLWSPFGDQLLVHKAGSDLYTLWSVRSDTVKETHLWNVSSPAAWKPDGSMVAAGDPYTPFGNLWTTGAIWHVGMDDWFGDPSNADENHISALAWSLDGRQLAIGYVEARLDVIVWPHKG